MGMELLTMGRGKGMAGRHEVFVNTPVPQGRKVIAHLVRGGETAGKWKSALLDGIGNSAIRNPAIFRAREPMCAQQRSELFFKRVFLMMLSLFGDVPFHDFELRSAHGEDAVAFLPSEVSAEEARRVRLQFLDSSGGGQFRRNRDEQVNVVGRSAGLQQAEAEVASGPAHIGVKIVGPVERNEARSFAG